MRRQRTTLGEQIAAIERCIDNHRMMLHFCALGRIKPPLPGQIELRLHALEDALEGLRAAHGLKAA